MFLAVPWAIHQRSCIPLVLRATTKRYYLLDLPLLFNPILKQGSAGRMQAYNQDTVDYKSASTYVWFF